MLSMSFNDTIKLCDIISSVSDSTKLALSMVTLIYLELTGSMVLESHLLKNISLRSLKKIDYCSCEF